MIYSPGGMGLDDYPPAEGGTVRFGGACFVNAEASLRASVKAFQQAVQAVLDEADAYHAGFNAFPAGRWMDALRVAKCFPKHARCPFKNPERVAAWQHGYADAHVSLRKLAS